jgi:hypothetical protein
MSKYADFFNDATLALILSVISTIWTIIQHFTKAGKSDLPATTTKPPTSQGDTGTTAP